MMRYHRVLLLLPPPSLWGRAGVGGRPQVRPNVSSPPHPGPPPQGGREKDPSSTPSRWTEVSSSPRPASSRVRRRTPATPNRLANRQKRSLFSQPSTPP